MLFALFVRLNACYIQYKVSSSQIFIFVIGICKRILVLPLVQVSLELLISGLRHILALAPEDVLAVDFVLLSHSSVKSVPVLNVETKINLEIFTLTSVTDDITCQYEFKTLRGNIGGGCHGRCSLAARAATTAP